jgi:hypothetical protein
MAYTNGLTGAEIAIASGLIWVAEWQVPIPYSKRDWRRGRGTARPLPPPPGRTDPKTENFLTREEAETFAAQLHAKYAASDLAITVRQVPLRRRLVQQPSLADWPRVEPPRHRQGNRYKLELE